MFNLKYKRFKQFKTILAGFLPSKYVLLVGAIFFLGGLIFALFNPQAAQSSFYGGIYTGKIMVLIQVPDVITFKYAVNQLFYYFGANVFQIFLKNSTFSIICIFSGFLIIPEILIGLFTTFGAITGLLIVKLGAFKAFLIIFGSFHLYFELLAVLLVIDAFLKFYGSIYISIKKRDLSLLKKLLLNEFLPILFKIIILLAIGAIIEVFWSTWWVYINTVHYVSWYDFYLGTYSWILV